MKVPKVTVHVLLKDYSPDEAIPRVPRVRGVYMTDAILATLRASHFILKAEFHTRLSHISSREYMPLNVYQ